MKIAFISDIHANLEALKSVLEDCKNMGVNKIVCLGDTIGKGIHPHECIELVRQNCDVVLRGNTDDRFSSNPEDFKNNAIEHERIKFNQSLMTKEDIEYLQSLPYTYEFYMAGNLVRAFHAKPDTPYGFINDYDTDMKMKREAFLPSKYTESQEIADIAIFGHIHYPFMLSLYNKMMFNPGSVGINNVAFYDENFNSKPDLMTQAHYLVFEGELTKEVQGMTYFFRNVPYDIQKELEANKGTNLDYEALVGELTKARYREGERVDKFIESRGYTNLKSAPEELEDKK